MSGHLPLHGVRVLEVASVLAGPYAGALLALLGAEVVKVEHPDGGDAFRGWGTDDSPHFAQFNRDKQSIAVDITDPRGAAAVLALVADFDVLLENSRPGRMAHLGLGPDDCAAVNPALVYVSISGFGSVGPMATRAAYDGIGQSVSGLLGLLSIGEEEPSIGPSLGDMVTGIVGAAAVLAGLVGQARAGRGALVETSMLEAVTALIGDAFTQVFTSGAEPDRAVRARQSQIYSVTSADDRRFILHLSTSDKFFRNLARAIGKPELVDDQRFATYASRMANHAELGEELRSTIRQEPAARWEQQLGAADVPFGEVLSVSEAAVQPQAEQLELFGPARADGLRALRGPWRIDGARPGGDGRPPRLGADTRAVLSKVLAPETLDELAAAGVINPQ